MATELSYSIRPATPDDAEVVVEMIKELADFQNMLNQCKLTVQQFREDGFGCEPFFHCIIAEEKLKSGEVKVAGHALFCYIYSTFKGKSVYLEVLKLRIYTSESRIGSME